MCLSRCIFGLRVHCRSADMTDCGTAKISRLRGSAGRFPMTTIINLDMLAI